VNGCENIRLLLERHVDEECSSAEAAQVEEHLRACEACAWKVALLRREAELLREALASGESAPETTAGLWARARRARRLRLGLRWGAVAAAAVLVLALFAGLFTGPGSRGAPLGRVTLCSGPLELRGAGGWEPLATYATLRAGDAVRCPAGSVGGLVVDFRRRFDLDAGTELVFSADDGNGGFRIEMPSGRLHAELSSLRRPFAVVTPVADVVATAERSGVAGGAEIEVALRGAAREPGRLGRLSLLPAAWAAEEEPTLEVIVHSGVAVVINRGELATAVGPEERIVVGSEGPMPEPEPFDRRLVRPWWIDRATLARRAAEAEPPAPVRPPEARDAREAPEPVAGPPAPADLAAAPDLEGVLLTWSPVEGPDTPVADYGVYRRAPGDTDFGLVTRFPAADEPVEKYVFRDDGVPVGAAYEYAVAAARRADEGELIEGPMSPVVTGSPMLRVRFLGLEGDAAVLRIDRAVGDAVQSVTFRARPCDAASGEGGRIGGPAAVGRAPGGDGEVQADFGTGYHLVDILAEEDGATAILIENALGITHRIPQTPGS